MRIHINALNGRLLPALPAPPVRIADEEQLLVREVIQARQVLVRRRRRGRRLAALPRRKRRAHAPCVGDVLAERELAVDVQRLSPRALDGEFRVLLHEALRARLERRHGPVRPPVGVVAVLVVMAAGGVEGVRQLVAGHGPEGPVGEVLWHVDVEDGELHDAGGEDDFVARRVVVCVYGGHGHAPFVAVDGFAEGGPFVGDFEAGHGKGVGEEGGGGDVYGEVVVLESWRVHDVRALEKSSAPGTPCEDGVPKGCANLLWSDSQSSAQSCGLSR
jgi:hypothetical protein